MDPSQHVPSLTHLRDFARARKAGRRTHVAQDRAQVTAPVGERFPAFYYEKFLSAVIEYIDNGCFGGALERVVEAASARKRASYAAAARGMSAMLSELQPIAAKRKQRNVVVNDNYVQLVSLRFHLLIELADQSVLAAHFYFSEKALTEVELRLMETSIALATLESVPGAAPAIAMARSGRLHLIDVAAATSADRVEELRNASEAYLDEWRAAA